MIESNVTVRTFGKANFLYKFFLEFFSEVRDYIVPFLEVLVGHLGPLCFWTKIENLNRPQSWNVSSDNRIDFFLGQ